MESKRKISSGVCQGKGLDIIGWFLEKHSDRDYGSPSIMQEGGGAKYKSLLK